MKKQGSMMEEKYNVNRFTMAILPLEEGDSTYSKVLETDKEIIVKAKPLELIDRSCRYFGSSYEGRKAGTKEATGITHKPPIVVDPASSIYFFPTSSSSKLHCAWLSHGYVDKYDSINYYDTEVLFVNGDKTTVSVSKHSFQTQLYRTAQLRTVISSRIEEEQQKMSMMLFPKDKMPVSFLYEQLMRDLKNQH